MMELHAVILGLIQGLTEFLPISSSGHLIFVPHLFGWQDQGIAFDVVVHLGSLLAVVIYYRRILWAILTAFFSRSKDIAYEDIMAPQLKQLGWYMIVSIIPAAVVGLLIEEVLQIDIRSALVVAVNLILWGIVLGIADRYSKKQSSNKTLEQLNLKTVLIISFAQALALIPGTSRSGITMTAGLFSGLSRKTAATFSFLMSVPVIAIAGAMKVLELIQDGLGDMTLTTLGLGFIAAAVSGFLAIAGLMKVIQKWSFMPFVVYRVVVGLVILLFFI